MTPWLILTTFACVEGIAIMHASDASMLRGLIVVNMLLISCAGALLGAFGPLITNYGNVWYAAVVAGQFLILDRYGRLAASATIPRVYAGVTLFLVCTYPLAYAPLLPGNEHLGGAVQTLAGHRPQILIASYAAFGLTMATLDLTFAAMRRWSRSGAILISVVVAQTVDTLVFFPIAFIDLGMSDMARAALAGWLIKVPLTLAIVAVGLASRAGMNSHAKPAVRA